MHHLAVVERVGLRSINGAGCDGRCGHDVELHIIGIVEVMPQRLQLWQICIANESAPSRAECTVL